MNAARRATAPGPRVLLAAFAAALTATVLAVAGATPALGDVRLPALVGDHMVLQRDREVVLWGFADPGEAVKVEVAGVTREGQADGDGAWRVTLPALPAGGPHEVVIQGNNRVVLTDVLVGDVWVCSGQSNMVWTVGASKDADAEKKAADFPSIRAFTVATQGLAEPDVDCRGAWTAASPATVAPWSAVAYFFGREIHRTLEVPVGLVVTAVGGTLAEAWTPAEAVAEEPLLAGLWTRAQRTLKGYDPREAEAKFKKAHTKWKKEAASDRRAGRPPPPEPRGPADPRASLGYPGSLWNGMVAPLLPMTVRGFLWYQGESNAPRAAQYRVLFPTLIRAWRRAFDAGDLPFYFVQLANFGAEKPSGGDSPWAELREAQLLTLREGARTGMAVTIDIGEPADIHPKNKQDVGIRLARWALGDEYGRKDVEVSGPLFREARVDGSKVTLAFDHVGGGLVTSDGGEPVGFAVASAKGEFVPALARIEGDAVVVWSPRVPHPAAVRYAWADAPESANLANAAGLPASPFRTDDRPWVTAGRE